VSLVVRGYESGCEVDSQPKHKRWCKFGNVCRLDYAKKLQPTRGNFVEVFDAMQLGTLCNTTRPTTDSHSRWPFHQPTRQRLRVRISHQRLRASICLSAFALSAFACQHFRLSSFQCQHRFTLPYCCFKRRIIASVAQSPKRVNTPLGARRARRSPARRPGDNRFHLK
jgi:hypothetical protein